MMIKWRDQNKLGSEEIWFARCRDELGPVVVNEHLGTAQPKHDISPSSKQDKNERLE